MPTPPDYFNLPADPEYAPGLKHPRVTDAGYDRLKRAGVLDTEIPLLQEEDHRIAGGNWSFGQIPHDYQDDLDALMSAGCSQEEAEAILGTVEAPEPISFVQYQADAAAASTKDRYRATAADWHQRHPGKRAEYQRKWRAKSRSQQEGQAADRPQTEDGDLAGE